MSFRLHKILSTAWIFVLAAATCSIALFAGSCESASAHRAAERIERSAHHVQTTAESIEDLSTDPGIDLSARVVAEIAGLLASVAGGYKLGQRTGAQQVVAAIKPLLPTPEP